VYKWTPGEGSEVFIEPYGNSNENTSNPVLFTNIGERTEKTELME